MWALNGQWYSSTMWMNGSNTASIVAAAYGSRTCMGLSGASSASGSVDFLMRINPSATASDDARKMAIINRIRLATETLSLSSGESQQIGLIILTDSAESSGSRIDISIYVYNDGGTYVIRCYVNDYAGAQEWTGNLGTVTAGTTFYTLELYAYLDKIDFFWNSGAAAADTVTFSADKTDLRMNRIQFYWEDTHAVWHLDDYWTAHEEVDFSTAAAYSTTNGSPDDATIYLIKSSVISDAIAAGDAEEIDVADGAFTVTLTDEDDYLLAKVLDGNDGGFAVKLAYAGSTGWSKSEWGL